MADSLTLNFTEARLLLAGWVRQEPSHRLSLSRLAAQWGGRYLLVPVVADVFCRSLCSRAGKRQARLRIRLADAGNLGLCHWRLAAQARIDT